MTYLNRDGCFYSGTRTHRCAQLLFLISGSLYIVNVSSYTTSPSFSFFSSLLSPLSFSRTDRYALEFGGLLLVIFVADGVPLAGCAFFLLFFGSSIVYAAIQKITSLSVAKVNLARTMSVQEFSWPVSGLLGLPAVGFVLSRASFDLVFWGLIALHGAVAAYLAGRLFFDGDADTSAFAASTVLPSDVAGHHTSVSAPSSVPDPATATDLVPTSQRTIRIMVGEACGHFAFILSHRRSLAFLLFQCGRSLPGMLITKVFAQWLIDGHHAHDADTVGLLSLVLSCGQLVGNGLVFVVAGRLPLLTGLFGGGVAVTCALVGLAFAQQTASVVPALVMMGVMGTFAQFTATTGAAAIGSGHIVAASQGTLFALYAGAFGGMNVLSSFVVTPLYHHYGLWGVAWTSAAGMFVGVLLLALALATSPSPVAAVNVAGQVTAATPLINPGTSDLER
jgi:hypothetical protein